MWTKMFYGKSFSFNPRRKQAHGINQLFKLFNSIRFTDATTKTDCDVLYVALFWFCCFSYFILKDVCLHNFNNMFFQYSSKTVQWSQK